MKPELKARWIAALRSGKFKQGRNFLARNNEFCCLGVACEVFKDDIQLKVTETKDLDLRNHYKMYEGSKYALPTRLMEYLELSGSGAEFPSPIKVGIHKVASPIGLNDTLGFTFAQIADIIEEQF